MLHMLPGTMMQLLLGCGPAVEDRLSSQVDRLVGHVQQVRVLSEVPWVM